METLEELEEFILDTSREGARGRLLARGAARAIIRDDGTLPQGAPAFGDTIDIDLAEYGFSLLRASLAMKEAVGAPNIWKQGFMRAGNTFEALVQNGPQDSPDRGFFRVIGAACYHLAGYSALAYSMSSQRPGSANLAPIEEAIILLMLRDLSELGLKTRTWLLQPEHNDARITASLQSGEQDFDDAIQVVVTSASFRALAYFEFALQTGYSTLIDEARSLLQRAISLSKHAKAIPLWWITRILLNLIDDLWNSSLHTVLPVVGPSGTDDYGALRRLFIGELYSRKCSEVELWPSQIDATQRATDLDDDLVVALPTSAGKTRIAEITALMSLSARKRVLLVTPLRALSAQTERSFRKTFSTLGFSVSSLYGASGMALGDEDALRSQDIVIATPEKLDFALRNDPTIIDNVGLVVLDEGHLIGPSEREIRYENLVQRLLRRPDSPSRRIVCLSAILPDGDQLNDLTAWIRNDAEGVPVKSSWRPTRQRFGTLEWHGTYARLGFDLEPNGPFIRHFIPQSAAISPRRTPFPRDVRELTLAAAWKFSSQGKRSLIFCTQRVHVEGYAKAIIALHRQGYLPTLLDDDVRVQRARAIGREWLGADHPAVQCLSIGVAIHHGRLPNPFLREVERLLAEGVLRVTVASPTLAQGLNLNAAVLLIPNLYRANAMLSGEEFANVAGRAGRAFIDLEGLVLHVMYDRIDWRKRQWRTLVQSARARSLLSGIVQIVHEVISRLARAGTLSRPDAVEYLANAQEAWFPADQPGDDTPIESLIELLDTTVIGLVEALDADSADLPRLLDEALTGSLWSRQIARATDIERRRQFQILLSRAKLIWNRTGATQRRSQFAMGVGLETGLSIDAIGERLTALLDAADLAALSGDAQSLAASMTELARHLLPIRPFRPDGELPGQWPNILASWLSGIAITAIGVDNMKFIEDAFVHRLVWALEAIRMRRRVNGGGSDFIEGAATACLETGLPQTMMAMLVRAGLPSRAIAQRVISETNPEFVTIQDMHLWLRSNEVTMLSDQPDWPTPETADIWKRFRNDALFSQTKKWSSEDWLMDTSALNLDPNINPRIPYRIDIDPEDHSVSVRTPDFRRLISIKQRLLQTPPSLLHVSYARILVMEP